MVSIKPTKNGPFLVKNLKFFKNSKWQDIPVQPEVHLCRCGGSSTKPFCDGTHVKIGFTDEKEEDRVPDKLETYEGKDITIHDNRGVCSHAGHCTDNSPKVFRMGKEPWIDPDGDDAEKTAKTIDMCPSGALSYTKDRKLVKDYDRPPLILIEKDGPYRVQGKCELEGEQPESKVHYTLFRCGHSKNKPFCNGQHWYVKFVDEDN